MSRTRKTDVEYQTDTSLKCAHLPRVTQRKNVSKVTSVSGATIELKIFTIQRSTRPSSVPLTLKRLVNASTAAFVPSLTMRLNSQSTFWRRWIKMLTSTCFTSRRFGAHFLIRSTKETFVSTLIIGRTIDGHPIHTNTKTRNVNDGKQKRTLAHTKTAADKNTVVDNAMGGRS